MLINYIIKEGRQPMVSKRNKVLYYECHITIEPVFEPQLVTLKTICNSFGFKVADLLMVKRKEDTPERSRFDTFCTGHSTDFKQLQLQMEGCIREIQKYEFKVWRYKIEAVKLDSNNEDSLSLL